MRIYLIRHGATDGNLLHRYIGSTDEPLCDAGIEAIAAKRYPPADRLVCSPMKRCIMTAELIYPDREYVICDNLRECDFGRWEGRSHKELSENKDYLAWCSCPDTIGYPDGEIIARFKDRCVSAFVRTCEDASCGSTAFIVHGGTIMALLEALHGGSFYDYNLGNGDIYQAEYDGKRISGLKRI